MRPQAEMTQSIALSLIAAGLFPTAAAFEVYGVAPDALLGCLHTSKLYIMNFSIWCSLGRCLVREGE